MPSIGSAQGLVGMEMQASMPESRTSNAVGSNISEHLCVSSYKTPTPPKPLMAGPRPPPQSELPELLPACRNDVAPQVPMGSVCVPVHSDSDDDSIFAVEEACAAGIGPMHNVGAVSVGAGAAQTTTPLVEAAAMSHCRQLGEDSSESIRAQALRPCHIDEANSTDSVNAGDEFPAHSHSSFGLVTSGEAVELSTLVAGHSGDGGAFMPVGRRPYVASASPVGMASDVSGSLAGAMGSRSVEGGAHAHEDTSHIDPARQSHVPRLWKASGSDSLDDEMARAPRTPPSWAQPETNRSGTPPVVSGTPRGIAKPQGPTLPRMPSKPTVSVQAVCDNRSDAGDRRDVGKDAAPNAKSSGESSDEEMERQRRPSRPSRLSSIGEVRDSRPSILCTRSGSFAGSLRSRTNGDEDDSGDDMNDGEERRTEATMLASQALMDSGNLLLWKGSRNSNEATRRPLSAARCRPPSDVGRAPAVRGVASGPEVASASARRSSAW